MPNSFYFACFTCRKAFKRPAAEISANPIYERPCPICQGSAKLFGQKFKSPPARDKDAWKVVEFLRNHGFYYATIMVKANASSPHKTPVRYPANMAEAEIFVEKYKEYAHSY